MIKTTQEIRDAFLSGDLASLLEVIDRDYVTRTVYLHQRIPREMMGSMTALKSWAAEEAKYLNVTIDPDVYTLTESDDFFIRDMVRVTWKGRRND